MLSDKIKGKSALKARTFLHVVYDKVHSCYWYKLSIHISTENSAGYLRRVQLILCPQRNFGRHLVIALSVRQSVHVSVRPSRFRVRSISPIFFEVGIPNLVFGYILGWWSVAYHFRVTVTLTLTSDLVFRIIVSGAYLLYYLK